MSRFRSMSAIKSYLGAQARVREEPPRKGRAPRVPRFVTISRQAGAGGTSVAEQLANLLNSGLEPGEVPWTVFDKNLVHVVLQRHSLPNSLAQFLEEDSVSELQEIVEGLFGGQPARRSLVAKTSRTILQLASMGNAIVVGRAGSVVTRHLDGGVAVRLVGSRERRVERLEVLHDLDEAGAAVAMKKSDAGRRGYVKRYFGEDIEDPLLYDLVINTDHVPYREAARLIAEWLATKPHPRSRS